MSATRKGKRPRINIEKGNENGNNNENKNENNKEFTGRLGVNLPLRLRNPETGKRHYVKYPLHEINKLKETAYSAAGTVFSGRSGWPRSTSWGVRSNNMNRNDPAHKAHYEERERHLTRPLEERYNRYTYSPLSSPKRPPGLGGSRKRRSTRRRKDRKNNNLL
jgi:hypothetical protein